MLFASICGGMLAGVVVTMLAIKVIFDKVVDQKMKGK